MSSTSQTYLRGKLSRVASCLCAFVVLFSCTKPATPADKLDAYFQTQFPADEPGGAVLVARGDSIIFSKGYGLADMKTREKITDKTLFNLGSISKTFVANAILILREQGKLSLDDSVYQYFPTFRNKSIAQRIRIKHLLTHTSGLPDNRQVSKDTAFYLTAKDPENWYPVTQTDTLEFNPGERFEYSNPAFDGLALIVEQVSGMKWQKFVEEKIFKPSGMISSTITDGPYPESGVSHGYIRSGAHWKELDYGEEPTFAAAGNGGVWSSTSELQKYEQALQSAVFLTRESIGQSRTVFSPPNWKDINLPHVGWSWFIGEVNGHATVGHTGSQGGFLCNYQVIPDAGIQVIILCNTPRDVAGMTEKAIAFATGN